MSPGTAAPKLPRLTWLPLALATCALIVAGDRVPLHPIARTLATAALAVAAASRVR